MSAFICFFFLLLTLNENWKKIIRQAEGYGNINIHFSLLNLALYGPLIQFFEELEGGASGVHIITLPSFSLIVTSIIRTICIHIIIA